jgi:hypothetical protein
VGILTREQIQAVDDLRSRIVCVDVPEWGGSVNIRPMDVRELDEYSNEAMRSKATGLRDFRTKLVAYCLCDENGNRLFSEKDIDVLAAKSGTVMDRLYRACDELNDIGPKKIEEIAGNSPAGQSDSSSSDLPAISSAVSTTSIECPSPSSGSGSPLTDTTNPSAESGSRSTESSSPSA